MHHQHQQQKQWRPRFIPPVHQYAEDSSSSASLSRQQLQQQQQPLDDSDSSRTSSTSSTASPTSISSGGGNDEDHYDDSWRAGQDQLFDSDIEAAGGGGIPPRKSSSYTHNQNIMTRSSNAHDGDRERAAYRAQRQHNNSDETERVRNSQSQQALMRVQQQQQQLALERSHNSSSSSGGNKRGRALMTVPEREDEVALMFSQQSLKPFPSYKGNNGGGGGHYNNNSSRTFSSRSLSSRGSHRSEYSKGSLNSNKRLKRFRHGEQVQQRPQPLYPRCNHHLILAITNLISLCSLASNNSNNNYNNGYSVVRSTGEVAALALSSITFILQFCMGVGYFHKPFREYITQTSPSSSKATSSKSKYGSSDGSAQKRLWDVRRRYTLEQMASTLLFLLTIIRCTLVLNPNTSEGYYYSSVMAVAGSEIWNTNLFYSTWINLYGSAYLWVECTMSRKACRVKKMWILTLFSSVCAVAALFVVWSSAACKGEFLAETPYCSSALTAALLGIVGIILSALFGLTLMLLTRKYQYKGPTWINSRTKWISLVNASVLLSMNSGVVALVTSPSGPGHEVGSAFLATWTTWILTALLLKCCVESFLVSPKEDAVNELKSLEGSFRSKSMAKSVGSGEGTHVSSTDDEEESVPDQRRVMRLEDVMDHGDDSDVVYEQSHGSESGTRSGGQRSFQYQVHHRQPPGQHLQHRHHNLPDPDEHDQEGYHGHSSNTACDAEGSYWNNLPNDHNNQALAVYPQDDAAYPQDENSQSNYGHANYESEPEPEVQAEDETSIDESGYYSGSNAVQVRTGPQEDISTLGGLTLEESSRLGGGGSRVPNYRAGGGGGNADPNGLRGSMLPDATHGLNYQNRSRSVQDPSTGPSMGNSTLTSQEEDPSGVHHHHHQPQQCEPLQYSQDNMHYETSFSTQEPSAHNLSYYPTKNNGDEIPSRRSSSYTDYSLDIDREWDFGSPSQVAAKPVPEGLEEQVKTFSVPTATTDGGTRSPGTNMYPRRPSRASLMSDLSPLQEESREGSGSTSPRDSSHVGSVTTRSDSHKSSSVESLTYKTSSDKKKKSSRSSKSSTESSRKKKSSAKREKPAPPPHPTHRSTTKQGKRQQQSQANNTTLLQGLSSGSSSIPITVSGNEVLKKHSTTETPVTKRTTSMTGSNSNPVTISGHPSGPHLKANDFKNIGSFITTSKKSQLNKNIKSSTSESSSSDFDIVVSDGQSVITELTNEGFDPVTPGAGGVDPRLNAALAAANNKTANTEEAAANYSNYVPTKSASSMREQQSQSHQPRPQAQTSLPKRMPLYNGSDTSSSQSCARTTSPNNSIQPNLQSSGGQEVVHPEVEAFLASAMKHARLSQSFGNFDDIPPTTDEESSVDHHQQRRRRTTRERRKSGGVDVSGSTGKSSGQDRRRKKKSSPDPNKSSGKYTRSSSKSASRSEPNLLQMKSPSQATALLQTILTEDY